MSITITPALARVAKEREEQQAKHFKTLAYDRNRNALDQLGSAASMLCLPESAYGCLTTEAIIEDFCPTDWSPEVWAKMMGKPYKERLIIAAALCVAEFERVEVEEPTGVAAVVDKLPRVSKEAFALLFNGRTIGNEVTDDEARQLKENGLVACFGASDDLLEMVGAISEEYSAGSGFNVVFTKNGVELGQDTEEALETIRKAWGESIDLPSNIITTKYCDSFEGERCIWNYNTNIPHSTFKIMEDGELFCVGLVFAMEDLK